MLVKLMTVVVDGGDAAVVACVVKLKKYKTIISITNAENKMVYKLC